MTHSAVVHWQEDKMDPRDRGLQSPTPLWPREKKKWERFGVRSRLGGEVSAAKMLPTASGSNK